MSDVSSDPIAQLEDDHEHMCSLFAQWRALCAGQGAAAQRQALAEQLCTRLTIHVHLEEELLGPLAREALGAQAVLVGAELVQVRDTLCRLVQLHPQPPLDEAGVQRLGAGIEAHIRTQREQLFPALRRCGADLALLGHRLRERRRELEAVAEALCEQVLVSAMA